MSNEITVPQVSVIENGIPVSQERIDPAVAQFIMAAAQAAQLVKLRKLEESKIPTGVKSLKRTVTDTIMKLSLYPPWISLTLVNGAGGGVTGWINDENDPLEESMIAASESWSVDMVYPVIKSLYLKAATGTTADVRIYGKVGRVG